MNDLNKLVDRLGLILAEKSKIIAEEKEIKNQLIQAGYEVVEGDIFRATISHVVSKRSDWKTIANKLEPSRQLITAYTKEVESDRVAVKSKKAS